MLIAPCTASSLGKMAHGVADNMLVTTYLSMKAPVFIAPAMDLDMYQHPSTQANINTLKGYGNRFVEPTSGFLASGLEGKGRMQEPDLIVEELERFFADSLKETTQEGAQGQEETTQEDTLDQEKTTQKGAQDQEKMTQEAAQKEKNASLGGQAHPDHGWSYLRADRPRALHRQFLQRQDGILHRRGVQKAWRRSHPGGGPDGPAMRCGHPEGQCRERAGDVRGLPASL